MEKTEQWPFDIPVGWNVIQATDRSSVADVLGRERVTCLQFHAGRNYGRDVSDSDIEIASVAERVVYQGMLYMSVVLFTPPYGVTRLMGFVSTNSVLTRGGGFFPLSVIYADVDETFSSLMDRLLLKVRDRIDLMYDGLNEITTWYVNGGADQTTPYAVRANSTSSIIIDQHGDLQV